MAASASTSFSPKLSTASHSSPTKSHTILPSPPSSSPIKLSTTAQQSQTHYRREFLVGGAALISVVSQEPPISEAREIEVGSYLPVSSTDSSFVVFKATQKDTPALRAGMEL
ncbi:hypothetical protein ACHQM5_018608 [Ranunculus cassubicifolius]